MRVLIGILVGVMAVLVLSALTAPMQDLMLDNRASNVFNCNGYIDSRNEVLSYNSTLESNTFGCSVTSFGIPLIVLAIMIGIIMFTLYGEPTREQTYSAYGQGY